MLRRVRGIVAFLVCVGCGGGDATVRRTPPHPPVTPAPATAAATPTPAPAATPPVWIALDTHVDTPQSMLDDHADITQRLTTGHLDIPRMREGGLGGAFFSIWV